MSEQIEKIIEKNKNLFLGKEKEIQEFLINHFTKAFTYNILEDLQRIDASERIITAGFQKQLSAWRNIYKNIVLTLCLEIKGVQKRFDYKFFFIEEKLDEETIKIINDAMKEVNKLKRNFKFADGIEKVDEMLKLIKNEEDRVYNRILKDLREEIITAKNKHNLLTGKIAFLEQKLKGNQKSGNLKAITNNCNEIIKITKTLRMGPKTRHYSIVLKETQREIEVQKKTAKHQIKLEKSQEHLEKDNQSVPLTPSEKNNGENTLAETIIEAPKNDIENNKINLDPVIKSSNNSKIDEIVKNIDNNNNKVVSSQKIDEVEEVDIFYGQKIYEIKKNDLKNKPGIKSKTHNLAKRKKSEEEIKNIDERNEDWINNLIKNAPSTQEILSSQKLISQDQDKPFKSEYSLSLDEFPGSDVDADVEQKITLIAEEARYLYNSFDVVIEENISNLKVFINGYQEEQFAIQINFGEYPKKPTLYFSEGLLGLFNYHIIELFQNLPEYLNWDPKNPIHVYELIGKIRILVDLKIQEFQNKREKIIIQDAFALLNDRSEPIFKIFYYLIVLSTFFGALIIGLFGIDQLLIILIGFLIAYFYLTERSKIKNIQGESEIEDIDEKPKIEEEQEKVKKILRRITEDSFQNSELPKKIDETKIIINLLKENNILEAAKLMNYLNKLYIENEDSDKAKQILKEKKTIIINLLKDILKKQLAEASQAEEVKNWVLATSIYVKSKEIATELYKSGVKNQAYLIERAKRRKEMCYKNSKKIKN